MNGSHEKNDCTPRSNAGRIDTMRVLAQAGAPEIERAIEQVVQAVDVAVLRAPETGLIMLRGRIGGDGAPFNVGELTVTRAAVELASGERGFGYSLGRDPRKAYLTALCDALWQSPRYQDALRRHVIEPLKSQNDEKRRLARQKTAATRVDFFTLVRGEDAT